MELKLYHYWRSSSSWRVRWALQHKQLSVTYEHVNLLESKQCSATHQKRNSLEQVPVLEVSEGNSSWHLTESTAIIEWLDDTHSQNPLLPTDANQRARVRQLAQIINAGTQPLQNLAVLKAISDDPTARRDWAQKWILKGLKAYEAVLSKCSSQCSVGDALTYADLFLIPQLYNADRFDVDWSTLKRINHVHTHLQSLKSYQKSHPDQFKPSDVN